METYLEEIDKAIDPVIKRLHDAAEAGRIDELREILDAGIDVNAPGRYQGTALYWATHAERSDSMLETIDFLLQRGADPNAEADPGLTPVTMAARLSRPCYCYMQNTDPSLLPRLLEAGGKIRLKEAVILGDLELIKQRCHEGEDPSGFYDWSEWFSHLSLAAGFGEVAVVATLLDLGANIEVTDDLGGVALLNAAESLTPGSGPLQTVRLLLDRGANINAIDWQEETALFRAAKSGNREIVQELLSRGARRTILDAIALGELELVERLFDKTETEGHRRHGFFAHLVIAAEHGHLEVVRYLLDRGENVDGLESWDAPESPGFWLKHESPLKVALERGHLEVANLLRARGAHEPSRESESGSA